MSTIELQQFSVADVAKKNGKNGAAIWIIHKDLVYDVSNYVKEHPGGADLIEEVAGTDATKAFNDVGHSSDAFAILKKLKIGQIIESERQYEQKKEDGRSCWSIITCGLC